MIQITAESASALLFSGNQTCGARYLRTPESFECCACPQWMTAYRVWLSRRGGRVVAGEVGCMAMRVLLPDDHRMRRDALTVMLDVAMFEIKCVQMTQAARASRLRSG